MFIDNEDIEAKIVALAANGAVSDLARVDRQDFSYFTDQLLGGETLDRYAHIDIADIPSRLAEVEEAQAGP